MTESMRDDPAVVRETLKWKRTGAFVLFLLVVSFPVYKAVESGRRSDALTSQQRALVTSGGQLWGLNCAACHGMQGLGVSAPALNSQEFLKSVSDEQVQGIIRGGIPGTAMPAWWNEYGGPLTDQQILSVVAYIRSWEKTAKSCPQWRTPACAPATGG